MVRPACLCLCCCWYWCQVLWVYIALLGKETSIRQVSDKRMAWIKFKHGYFVMKFLLIFLLLWLLLLHGFLVIQWTVRFFCNSLCFVCPNECGDIWETKQRLLEQQSYWCPSVLYGVHTLLSARFYCRVCAQMWKELWLVTWHSVLRSLEPWINILVILCYGRIWVCNLCLTWAR